MDTVEYGSDAASRACFIAVKASFAPAKPWWTLD
jgi:hypothetical protein